MNRERRSQILAAPITRFNVWLNYSAFSTLLILVMAGYIAVSAVDERKWLPIAAEINAFFQMSPEQSKSTMQVPLHGVDDPAHSEAVTTPSNDDPVVSNFNQSKVLIGLKSALESELRASEFFTGVAVSVQHASIVINFANSGLFIPDTADIKEEYQQLLAAFMRSISMAPLPVSIIGAETELFTIEKADALPMLLSRRDVLTEFIGSVGIEPERLSGDVVLSMTANSEQETGINSAMVIVRIAGSESELHQETF